MRTRNILLILLFFSLAFNTKCKADSLLINMKHPDEERILLYDGKCFLKFNIYESDEESEKGKVYKDIYVTRGSYEIKDNRIIFNYSVSPGNDTLKNRFYIWPPDRAGPDYIVDLEKMTEGLFGFNVELNSISVPSFFLTKGKFLKDGTLKLKRGKKYKIVAK